MKAVTIEQVVAWEPCGVYDDDDGTNYTPARIARLFDGRETLTARDIAALDIPAQDKLWALLHSEFLTESEMRAAARDYALDVIHLWDAPDVVAEYLRTGNEEIRAAASAAASAAAWAAASAAAWAAASAAASAAAWAAASAAAWAAAWDAASAAAWDDQVAYLVTVIEASE